MLKNQLPPELLNNLLEILSYALNGLLAWIALKLKSRNTKLKNDTVLKQQTPQSKATRDAIKKIREQNKM